MILGEKELRKLYPDLDDNQYQPDSIDLKIDNVEFFKKTDNVGLYGGNKHFPKMEELKNDNGFFTLKPHTSYIFTIQNKMKIPKDICQLYFSRSSLMRMGLICTTCIGDTSFFGYLKFLFFNSTDNDIIIEKGERVGTAANFEVRGSGIYNGDFNERLLY